jgi:hypothetical protein
MDKAALTKIQTLEDYRTHLHLQFMINRAAGLDVAELCDRLIRLDKAIRRMEVGQCV